MHYWVHDGGTQSRSRKLAFWAAVSFAVAWACTVAVSRIGPVLGLGPSGQGRLILSSVFCVFTGVFAWAMVPPYRFSPQTVLAGACTMVVLLVSLIVVLT